MSYDLAVFDVEACPHGRTEFLAWYHAKHESETAFRSDPQAISLPLRNWYLEMIKTFPPLTGIDAHVTAEEESMQTEYGVDTSMIYASFAWSVADQAFDTVVALAAKYGVGFFDVSSEIAEVWLPIPGGHGLALAHKE